MMRVGYVTNAGPQSGMGKPAREIARHLQEQFSLELDVFWLDALQRRPKPLHWWRLARHVPKSRYDLWHLTNQSVSFVRREPAVVTVYDLIELTDPQEKLGKLAARYLYSGITRAAQIICVSDFTKREVMAHYGIPEQRLTIIPLAAGEQFQPLPAVRETVGYHTWRQQQSMTPEQKIILYVGSEHPRKNLLTLARAFAAVRRERPDTVLVKVGESGISSGREEFLAALDQQGLRPHVRFLGNASDAELQFLYSAADVFVFPSTLEGFGLPPLEAMACGCPVVCSNAASLPEVVGEAALLTEPLDDSAFAQNILSVLNDEQLSADLRQRGAAQAARFSWDAIAAQTHQIYQRVCG